MVLKAQGCRKRMIVVRAGALTRIPMLELLTLDFVIVKISQIAFFKNRLSKLSMEKVSTSIKTEPVYSAEIAVALRVGL